MFAADFQPRVAAAALIALAHGVAIYAIAAWSPELREALSTPLTVHFLDTVESTPKPPLPRVDLVMPAIRMPAMPLADISVQESPPERAITVAALTTPSPPVTRAAAPKLISEVEYVQQPVPRYPPQSRRLREEGLVVLRVEIDEQGTASDIRIESSSGHSRLDAAAREAVARAVFRPYIEDGAPRRALVLIPIEFSLAGASA